MATKIRKSNYSRLSQDTRQKLRRLCFKPHTMSGMCIALQAEPDAKTYIIFEGEKVLAWALVSKTWLLDRKTAMFYTRAPCRKRGLATRLLKQIRRDYGDNLYIDTYCEASLKLYNKLSEDRCQNFTE